MKSFNLEELKRDCLNPKDENGNPLIYNGEPLTFSSEEELEERIVKITSEMCQKRKDNISLVSKDYDEMKEVLPELRKSLEKVKEKANIYKFSTVKDKNLDNNTCDKILELCESICLILNDYEKNIETMYTRFKNGTIRISAVGKAGQGKSTYAKYYTGLKDGRISTHKKENEETTGTVTTLINTDTDKDQYIVSYYTKKDILTTLNYYLKEIRNTLNDQQITILGVSNFEDFDRDFIQKRGSDPFLGIAVEKLSISITKGLRAFYSTDVDKYNGRFWYEYLNEKEIILGTVEEQQKHILMTDRSNLYLAVKEVKMYVKFEENKDIFANFEIVDTKGAGSAAGAHADKEIYDSIDISDAVFSIQTVNVDTKYEFYDSFLRSRYWNDKMFKNKHFILLNPYIDNDPNDAIKDLEKIGLANILYCGSLYSPGCPKKKCNFNNYDKNFDCILDCNIQREVREFVKYTVRNMLLRVSTMVSELDSDRIKKRINDKKVIAEKLNELNCLIGDKQYTYNGKEDVLKNIIRGFVVKGQRYIAEEQSKLGTVNDINKGYTDYLKEGREITLYDIIINSGNDLKKIEPIDQIKGCNNEDVVKNEIRKALEQAYETMFDDFTPDKEYSIEEHIGRYIEDFAIVLHKRLSYAMENLRKQKELEPEVRKEISSFIWRLFKLDKINNSTEGCWDLYDGQSKFFTSLNTIFKPRVSDDQSTVPLYKPYEMLYMYFNYCEDKEIHRLPDMDKNDYIDINKFRLREVATELIYDSHIHEKIAEIYNSHSTKKQKESLLRSLKEIIKGDDNIANDCKDFYLAYTDKIFTEEENSKIKLADTWKELAEIKVELSKISTKFNEKNK